MDMSTKMIIFTGVMVVITVLCVAIARMPVRKPPSEDDLIVEANEIWESKKDHMRDVSRTIDIYCTGLTKEQRKAIREAGRAGFVLGYLEGKK